MRRWWLRGKEENEGRARREQAEPAGPVPSRRLRRQAGTPKPSTKRSSSTRSPARRWASTRLSFRYKLQRHRHAARAALQPDQQLPPLSVAEGLAQDQWQDGYGGHDADAPARRHRRAAAADERIDDIQFYVDPRAELLIDDIVLYDAAAEGREAAVPEAHRSSPAGSTPASRERSGRAPSKSSPHDKPRTWKCASVSSQRRVRQARTTGFALVFAVSGAGEEPCSLDLCLIISLATTPIEVELWLTSGKPGSGQQKARSRTCLPTNGRESTISFEFGGREKASS